MGAASTAPRVLTWDDYRGWDDGERWELIGGEAFCMSPAPTSRHQAIVGDLFGHLYQHFRGKSCRPFVSPLDVKLSVRDVVQPDVVVVCDRSPIFPELALDLREIFTLPVPPAEQIDEVRESAPPYAAGTASP